MNHPAPKHPDLLPLVARAYTLAAEMNLDPRLDGEPCRVAFFAARTALFAAFAEGGWVRGAAFVEAVDQRIVEQISCDTVTVADIESAIGWVAEASL